MEQILSHLHYLISGLILMIGFFIVVGSYNLVKKLMGLAIFQTSVLLLYIASSYVTGRNVPIVNADEASRTVLYVNPLPHVLMLTAIVVGVATLAVGMAIVVRIKEEYNTIEDDEILAKDERDLDLGISTKVTR